MYYNVLAERVRYFKEKKEGATRVSKIFDEVREEGREEGQMEQLVNSVGQLMKNLQVDLAEACRLLGTTQEKYEQAKALL